MRERIRALRMTASVLTFPSERAIEVAWNRRAEHAQKLLDHPCLVNDPEWQAEDRRLQDAFYALMLRACEKGCSKVVALRRRG